MADVRIRFDDLPKTVFEFMDWPWERIEPFFADLADRQIYEINLSTWLKDWTRVNELIDESLQRLQVATTLDTTDTAAEQKYLAYLENIIPRARAAGQKLKEKLLSCGMRPNSFAIPIRNMKAEAEIFREANLPLFTEERRLANEYDRIIGAQTVQWEGKEITITQLRPVYQEIDRAKREAAWRLSAERQLADRAAINGVWVKLMKLRGEIAANAGYEDYRDYRWKQLLRFDYNPSDCETFAHAIADVVVPAAAMLYEKRRRQLGVETLRPWDLDVDPFARPPLRPFGEVAELEEKTAAIFRRLDPELGQYFQTMRDEKLLDLENRKGKAPGGYCTTFAVAGRPFVFMNAVGLHDDVQTLLHESGHSFHVFAADHLPYEQQKEVPMEFAEVASMAMELLAAPQLEALEGGFYTREDAARARLEHLQNSLMFWPYMAVVDMFQHWVYTHHREASDPARCDAKWTELWWRFMPNVDYRGFEEVMATGWHRKLHIHRYPFYYIEYGLAQLGAVQVWRRSLKNHAQALADYRRALALGGTVSLPELFAAAGAKFSFEVNTLQGAVALMMETIKTLETIQ